MKLLLEKGARVDLQEKNGYSTLMIATIGGHWKVIRALLKCGAQVDLQTINGETTLMIARQKGLNEIVKFCSIINQCDRGRSGWLFRRMY